MSLQLTEYTKIKLNTFYKKYPSLKFDDMINKMLDNTQIIIDNLDINNINNSLTSKIFDKIDLIELQIGQITDTIANQLINNMLTFKNDLKTEIGMIMNNNTVENIIPLLQKYNDELYIKTLDGFNNIIPKNNETLSNNISLCLKNLYESINQDTLRLNQQTINQNTLNDFINTIDNKFNISINGLQQNLTTNIGFTEKRLNTQIDDIKELSIVNKETENQILSSINKHFGKFDVSSVKGAFSESILNTVLTELYETAEIIDVSKESHRGDFIMNRNNKPKILFENKFQNENIPTHEVNKFIGDVLHEKSCGIFISQKSGICLKGNFEIDIDKNKNVLVYLTKVNYNPEIIKIAVNIVDYLKGIIDKIYVNFPTDSRTVNQSDIDIINREFITFFEKKMIIINDINSLKKTIDIIVKNFEDLSFPIIETLFIDKSNNISTMKPEFICICNLKKFDTAKKLNQHKASCKTWKLYEYELKNKSNEEIPENVVIQTIPENVAIQNTNHNDNGDNTKDEANYESSSNADETIITTTSNDSHNTDDTKKKKKYNVTKLDYLITCKYCKVETYDNKISMRNHENNCKKKTDINNAIKLTQTTKK